MSLEVLCLCLFLSLSILPWLWLDPKEMDGLLDRRRSPIKITYYGWIHITDNLRLADMFGLNPRTFANFIQILVCTIVMFGQSQNHIFYSTYDLWLCSRFCWLNSDWLPVRSKFLLVKFSIFGWWNPHVASNWSPPILAVFEPLSDLQWNLASHVLCYWADHCHILWVPPSAGWDLPKSRVV